LTETSRAVFLSYASQDTAAAQRICHALRAAGVEVWFDRSELRGGGGVWDQKIRRELQEYALFIPVISTNTAARHEGYFRLEWHLADQRTHRLARNRAFILPVCVDATSEMSSRHAGITYLLYDRDTTGQTLAQCHLWVSPCCAPVSSSMPWRRSTSCNWS
jgi:hypothetical protein